MFKEIWKRLSYANAELLTEPYVCVPPELIAFYALLGLAAWLLYCRYRRLAEEE